VRRASRFVITLRLANPVMNSLVLAGIGNIFGRDTAGVGQVDDVKITEVLGDL
jgi:hypothetical protein